MGGHEIDEFDGFSSDEESAPGEGSYLEPGKDIGGRVSPEDSMNGFESEDEYDDDSDPEKGDYIELGLDPDGYEPIDRSRRLNAVLGGVYEALGAFRSVEATYAMPAQKNELEKVQAPKSDGFVSISEIAKREETYMAEVARAFERVARHNESPQVAGEYESPQLAIYAARIREAIVRLDGGGYVTHGNALEANPHAEGVGQADEHEYEYEDKDQDDLHMEMRNAISEIPGHAERVRLINALVRAEAAFHHTDDGFYDAGAEAVKEGFTSDASQIIGGKDEETYSHMQHFPVAEKAKAEYIDDAEMAWDVISINRAVAAVMKVADIEETYAVPTLKTGIEGVLANLDSVLGLLEKQLSKRPELESLKEGLVQMQALSEEYIQVKMSRSNSSRIDRPSIAPGADRAERPAVEVIGHEAESSEKRIANAKEMLSFVQSLQEKEFEGFETPKPIWEEKWDGLTDAARDRLSRNSSRYADWIFDLARHAFGEQRSGLGLAIASTAKTDPESEKIAELKDKDTILLAKWEGLFGPLVNLGEGLYGNADDVPELSGDSVFHITRPDGTTVEYAELGPVYTELNAAPADGFLTIVRPDGVRIQGTSEDLYAMVSEYADLDGRPLVPGQVQDAEYASSTLAQDVAPPPVPEGGRRPTLDNSNAQVWSAPTMKAPTPDGLVRRRDVGVRAAPGDKRESIFGGATPFANALSGGSLSGRHQSIDSGINLNDGGDDSYDDDDVYGVRIDASQ